MSAPEPDGISWHTSSYSGSDCVEVGWRTSSYSGSACVEVAPVSAGVLVRDSKNAAGPALAVTATAWRAFPAIVTP